MKQYSCNKDSLISKGGIYIMSLKPFIHLFKNGENYYVYDVNKNSVLKITKHVFELLKMNLSDEEVLANEFIKSMKDDGYLSSKKITEIIHPEDELLEYYLESKVSMIALQLTQQCNLRCEYCVYSGKYENRVHSDKNMSFKTAQRAIDFLVEHSRDKQNVSISFYGGEPLIQFNLIKDCIEYAEKVLEGKKLFFNITTNATLINEKIIRYFKDHNVFLLISIDGPEDIHDSSRKFISGEGTFKTIINSIKMIREKVPDYMKNISLNAVINCNSNFNNIDKFFSCYEEVKDIDLNFQFVKDGCNQDNIYATQKFFEEYDNEVLKSYLSLMGKGEHKILSKIIKQNITELIKEVKKLTPTKCLPERGHPSGTCIPGVQRPFIDVDGNIFPCEKVNETSKMIIGNIYDGFDIYKIREFLNIGKYNEKQCKNCWASIFCTLCISKAEKIDSVCNEIKNNTELMLKNYCTFKEAGVNFNDVKI